MSSYPEQLPRLRAGWHLGPDDGTCLMEHVSQVEGLKFTDTPRCTDPLLATLAQLVNDAVSDRARPQLVSFARRLASRPRVGIGSAPAIVLAVLGPALERRPARRDLRRHQARARRRAAAASRSGSGTDLRTRLLDELYRRGPARHALMSAVRAAASTSRPAETSAIAPNPAVRICARLPGGATPCTARSSHAPVTLPSAPRTASPRKPRDSSRSTIRARAPAASPLAIQIKRFMTPPAPPAGVCQTLDGGWGDVRVTARTDPARAEVDSARHGSDRQA